MKNITPEMISALSTIRQWARTVNAQTSPRHADKATADAINLLDDADVFAAIDADAWEHENDTFQVRITVRDVLRTAPEETG